VTVHFFSVILKYGIKYCKSRNSWSNENISIKYSGIVESFFHYKSLNFGLKISISCREIALCPVGHFLSHLINTLNQINSIFSARKLTSISMHEIDCNYHYLHQFKHQQEICHKVWQKSARNYRGNCCSSTLVFASLSMLEVLFCFCSVAALEVSPLTSFVQCSSKHLHKISKNANCTHTTSVIFHQKRNKFSTEKVSDGLIKNYIV